MFFGLGAGAPLLSSLPESEGGVCPPHLVSLHRSMLEDMERASLSMGRSAGGTLGPANGPPLGSRYAR